MGLQVKQLFYNENIDFIKLLSDQSTDMFYTIPSINNIIINNYKICVHYVNFYFLFEGLSKSY